MKSYNQLIRHDGNKDLFRAVKMSLTAMANGYPFHIHAQGLRGTGKTSILRSVRDVLPPIVRIKNCIYNCDPDNPHCPDHRYLPSQAIAAIGSEVIPRPFLEISQSAKIGTIAGSIDLSKLTDKNQPIAALLPGTIPQANRGIIFIDEVNRLADTSPEIVDVLLDVMGTKPGRIQVEETGIPTVDLPVSVTIWAASNPDEEPGALAQIRKQLADRFDLVVNMGRPADYQVVKAILAQQYVKEESLDFQQPFSFPNLRSIVADERIKDILAAIYVDFGLESLRAIEAMETAAGIAALLDGRKSICINDIITVVPMVLGHRTDDATIGNILRYLNQSNGHVMPALESNPRAIAEEGLRNRPIQEERNWNRLWKAWCTKIKEKLRWFSRSRSANSGDGKARNTTRTASHEGNLNKNRTNEQENAGRESRIADPTKVEIISPPRQAVPLTSLTIENFVSDGETKKHG